MFVPPQSSLPPRSPPRPILCLIQLPLLKSPGALLCPSQTFQRIGALSIIPTCSLILLVLNNSHSITATFLFFLLVPHPPDTNAQL